MTAGLLRDLRFALRSLRRHPWFSAAAIGMLALGVGANTAIFTVVHSVLLRRLPVAEADRLVAVYVREPGSDNQPYSIADFLDVRAESRALDALVAWGGWSANLTGVEESVALKGQWTSAGFFSLLGARPALGRLPLPEEEAAGGARVVLLGDALWRTRFGADRGILGRSLTLNGEPYMVIGVLPPEFPFFASEAQLATPLILETDKRRQKRGAGFLRVLGRLRPGTSIEAASGDLDSVMARLRATYPETNAGKQGVRIQPLAELVVGNYRRSLIVLQAAVALVLLIACTNLANLLLARSVARRPELALRTALGAGRSDLVRQLLAEALVLAICGGALGVGIALAGVRALLALGPAQMPRATEIGLSSPVLLFDLGLSILAGLGMGLVPAFQASGRGVADGLRGAARGSTTGRRGALARATLVAAEVGLSLVLLFGAGLLLRTLRELQATNPGFRQDHLVAIQLSLPKNRYGTPGAIARYAEEITGRLGALPGVEFAAAASLNPLTQWRASISFLIEGRPEIDRAKAPLANYRAVSPGYFETLGVPLRAGRSVDTHDGADSVAVAWISETLARRHFAGQSPLGARLTIDDTDPRRTVEVVGVVGDVKFTGLDADGTADVYVPFAQTPPDVSVWLANIFCAALRTRAEPAAVIAAARREVRALDRDVAMSSIRSMDDALTGSLSERRFSTMLLEVFGLAALILALAGIYAVTAFGVVERTTEIGVRLSLGSGRGRILGLVLRQSLRPVVAGLALGTAAALSLARLISGLLYGVEAHDARTLTAAAILLALTAGVASVVPALRATRIDPVRALRGE